MGVWDALKPSRRKQQRTLNPEKKMKETRKWVDAAKNAVDKDDQLAAIEHLNGVDHADILAEIAMSDAEYIARLKAMGKLYPKSHRDLLWDTALRGSDISMRKVALKRLSRDDHHKLINRLNPKKDRDLMVDIATDRNGIAEQWRAMVVQRMDHATLLSVLKDLDANLLKAIASGAKRYTKEIRSTAIDLLCRSGHLAGIVRQLDPVGDEDLLVAIASDTTYNQSCRIEALQKLDEQRHQAVFAEIVKAGGSEQLSLAAMERLYPDQHSRLLTGVAKNETSFSVVRVALKKLALCSHGAGCLDLPEEIPLYYLLGTIKRLSRWGKLKIDDNGFELVGVSSGNMNGFFENNGFCVQETGYFESDPVVSPGSGGRNHMTRHTYAIDYQGIQMLALNVSRTTSSQPSDSKLHFSYTLNRTDGFSRNVFELLLLTIAAGLGKTNFLDWLDEGILSIVNRLHGITGHKVLHISKLHLHRWGFLSESVLLEAASVLEAYLIDHHDHPGALALFGYVLMALDELDANEAIFTDSSQAGSPSVREIALYFRYLLNVKTNLTNAGIAIGDPKTMGPIFEIGNTLAQSEPYDRALQHTAPELGYDFNAWFGYRNCLVIQVNNHGVMYPAACV